MVGGHPFSTIASTHEANACTLALIAERGNRVDVKGTAVLIAPGCAITAKHVLDYTDEERSLGAPRPSPEADHGIRAIPVGLPPDRRVEYRVRHSATPPIETDLALLHLSVVGGEPPGFKWPCLTLDLLPPRLGARIVGFGYRAELLSAQPGKLEIAAPHLRTEGVVSELHLQGRGSRMPFPCVETTARVDGGMSGGPVFSERGSLLGVWSSSLPASGPDDQHTSYFSLLWPLLAAPVVARLNPADWTIENSLFAAAEAGRLAVENLDRFSATPDERGRIVRIEMRVPKEAEAGQAK